AFFYLFTMLAGQMPDGTARRVLMPLVPEYIGYADQGLTPTALVSQQPRIDVLGDHEFKYRIDFEAVAKTLDRENVGAICASRPTNPTGNVLTDDEVAHLARLASERQI